MLGFLGLLLVVWLVITVIGFVFHTLIWLAIIGIVLFVATSALGWTRRNGIGGGGRRSLR
jgi:hypothetical protein